MPLVRGDWLCLTGIAATGRVGQTYARHVQVHETNLKQLVQGEKQFRVPLWQRQYTWRITDHRLLWRDILAQYSAGPRWRRGSPVGAFPRQHRVVTGSFGRK